MTHVAFLTRFHDAITTPHTLAVHAGLIRMAPALVVWLAFLALAHNPIATVAVFGATGQGLVGIRIFITRAVSTRVAVLVAPHDPIIGVVLPRFASTITAGR
jgi:hypothetical protein